ncbi:Phosphoglucomutase/phosphomannomutase [Candidatus Bilamarchaeum dharawalense]|uniref:Phosphoglucomutase/phosphomannomutase n=1 Tax=Candidatus Bilamarchaeum dharawalense TaxID=2885759 RepID=A0A5E4LLG3_9ARCH|nr:Phosphoglucomutase/phosphomannomutase [Candidatus Bilamarchaeum dharawalense]
MSKYFGTNGVRGRFNELTPELTLKLSQAIGIYFKRGKIIVARDCRITGEVLSSCVMAGLVSVGCEVIDIGIASSPTAEFMIKKLKTNGCIIVSASHNPPEWNALKIVDGKGIAISKERGEEIEKLLDRIELSSWDRIGKVKRYGNASEDHVKAILEAIGMLKTKTKKTKIVIDCGNGTAALIAPKLFREMGVEFLSLNSHPDGRFPGRPSEPTEVNVKELLAMVKSSNADAGIAWDGDGDRVIFVDEKGRYVIGDRVYALSIIWKLNEQKNGDVVTTVATSKAVEDVARKYGAKVRYTAIGAPYLCEEMVKVKSVDGTAKPNAIIGGEEVGGVIWPEFSLAKDGFLTAAVMVQKICEKPLSEWLEQVPDYFNVKIKMDADAERKIKIVEKVLTHAKNNKLDFIDIDGVRINLPEGWVIVRASGTENYVRLFAEAKTKEGAEKLAAEYEKIVK